MVRFSLCQCCVFFKILYYDHKVGNTFSDIEGVDFIITVKTMQAQDTFQNLEQRLDCQCQCHMAGSFLEFNFSFNLTYSMNHSLSWICSIFLNVLNKYPPVLLLLLYNINPNLWYLNIMSASHTSEQENALSDLYSRGSFFTIYCNSNTTH